mmetsp:Transcript_98033/g.169884  ORF Transcript_98033/g.169884 Transcript_98033/m.169884 type:complete len:236 (-) Transcript_98033:219-926(-)
MDPKGGVELKAGSMPEDLLHGLSLLGPSLGDLFHQVTEIKTQLNNLTLAVQKKADCEEMVSLNVEIRKKADQAEVSDMAKKVDTMQANFDKFLTDKEQMDKLTADLQRFEVTVSSLASSEKVDDLASRMQSAEVRLMSSMGQIISLQTSVDSLEAKTAQKLEDHATQLQDKASTASQAVILEKNVEALTKMIEKQAEQQQDQIRNLRDILLPVARTVRGWTPASAAPATNVAASG